MRQNVSTPSVTITPQHKDLQSRVENEVHAENIKYEPGTKKQTNKFLIRPVSAQHRCQIRHAGAQQ